MADSSQQTPVWQPFANGSTSTGTPSTNQLQQQSATTLQASTYYNPFRQSTANSNNNGNGNHMNCGNNNYVDFNQFIMQHNLVGGGSGGGGMDGGFSSPHSNSPRNQIQYFNAGPHMPKSHGDNAAPTNGLTRNDGDVFNDSYNNKYSSPSSTTTSNSIRQDFYTVFQNSTNSATSITIAPQSKLNPFATPYEFVPQFDKLRLSENKQQQQHQKITEDPQNFRNADSGTTTTEGRSVNEESGASAMVGRRFNNDGDEDPRENGIGHAKMANHRNRNRGRNKGDREDHFNGGNSQRFNDNGGSNGSGGGVGGLNANNRRNHRERKKYDERRSLDLNRSNSDLTSIGGGSGGGGPTGGQNPHAYSNPSTSGPSGGFAGAYGGSVSRSTGATNKTYNGHRPDSRNNGYGHGGGGDDDDDDVSTAGDSKYQPKGMRGERDRDRRNQKGKRSVDNNRSNKRRDDWNRNRDRINGFRVDEKYNYDTGKESPLQSPEKKLSPKKTYADSEKLSQREKLIRDIEHRRLECLVCVEPIKSHHGVWSCQNCYHILHLQCIIKWASSSKSEDGWRCPACQNVLKDVPRDYYCFCGKQKNPPYSRFEVAHTCAEVCGRIDGCPHACTLLCHPGPCPPCQANVKRECGCGKTSKSMQCCVKETIECEAVCGKLLGCEVDTCQAQCHQDKCPPCEKKIDQKCHCGKQERQVACTRDSQEKRTYSCGKPCGRDLECGNHKCKDCCHPGECRPCKQSPDVVTSCPCGKMPVLPGQRLSCLDTIPVCESACGKTLRCGKPAHPHHCVAKCHLGNCPPCNKQTAVKCRCGHMDQMIKCRQLSTRADDARCKKRCVKKRSCGKHKCNQECCIDIDHICPLSCSYTLSCGKHKCDQPCHRGNCPPCYRSSFEELYCECGAEVIYPPVPCGTKRPLCKKPCSRAHPCEHPPQHTCHSAATCPPCMMFTTKWCFGQHEQRKTVPCSQESFSCGLACNKELTCGRHRCIKSCHEGVCQVANEVCKQSCTTLRGCGHKCMAACHDGSCPDTPCKEMVEVQCECGNRKQMRSCHDLAREYSRITTAQLASSMAEMQRGNYLELSEILAPVKLNKTNKTLDCNEECRLLERNRRLAIGLQIRNPDLPQKLMTKYTEFTRNFAKRDPTLVKSIHDALTNLVKLAKESKQKSRSHSFPTMNREKRQLVHEMCEMFGVESVAYDTEPNRNVVATAFKERSWLPATSIMEVVQRESGQRRVPVPSNNAWGLKR